MNADGEIQYGNARCNQGHPLWLVAEGYAYCYEPNYMGRGPQWWPWRLAKPRGGPWWHEEELEDGTPAWVIGGLYSKAEVLALIQGDMDAHRALYAREAVAS